MRHFRVCWVLKFRFEPLNRHHHPLQPRQRRAEPLPRKLQLAAVMRLQAHQPVGERVVALVDQQLQPQELARSTSTSSPIVRPENCCASRSSRPNSSDHPAHLCSNTPDSAQSRWGGEFRGGRSRRCGCRTESRAAPRPSPSIPGASPARPCPTANPIPSAAFRQPESCARSRSRRRCACHRRFRSGPRPSSVTARASRP